MDHQQQTLRAIGHAHQHRTQQRALTQVEAALGFLAQGFKLCERCEGGLPQHLFGLMMFGTSIRRRPAIHTLDKPGAQGVMVHNQGL